MNKLLLHGMDTLAGANFALALRDRFELLGLSTSGWQAPDCRALSGDPHDADQVAWHVQTEAPRAIVYCGPLSRSSWDLAGCCDFDVRHETTMVGALARAAACAGSQLVVLSSDAVFSGPRMFHPETSAAMASTPPAEAARAIEQAVEGTPTLVVRSHVYGWSPGDATPGFAEQVWEQLSGGLSCSVDAHRYATPILAADLAELCCRALDARLEGLYHVTGAERTNQFRFAAELALAGGFTGRQVLLEAACTQAATRPFIEETSLATRAIRRVLETPLPMLREGLQRFAAEAATGWRQELEDGPRLTPVPHAA